MGYAVLDEVLTNHSRKGDVLLDVHVEKHLKEFLYGPDR